MFIAAAAATMFFMTSCQKEEVANQGFTARLENGSSNAKTILDGTHIKWEFGTDQVKIYDAENNSGTFTAQQHSSYSSDATCAELINTDVTLAETGGYKAIYPADIALSANTILLPKIQNSDTGELSKYPMYAESNTKSLQFKNICSVLKLTLQKANKSVSKIQIVTDKLTTGTFEITYTNGIPTISPSTSVNNHTAVTTLQLANNVSINTAHDFYIYLPANTYDYMQVKVYDANGLMFFKTWQKTGTQSSMTLVRSQYHALSFGENDIEFHEGNVNGLFHIGPNTIVTFANGNFLKSNSDNTYKFADEQYDYTETGYTFRFTWGSTSGIFSEPGNNTISNATGTWRTMTADEWRYVCNNTHNTSTSQTGTRGDFVTYHTRAHLMVTKADNSTTIGGMILFPDKFHWPLDASKQPPSNSFDGGSITTDWNGITLDYDDWKVLEDAGCVFLPMTHGYYQAKNGGGATSNTEGNPTYGCYWTKTWYSSNDKARFTQITPTQFLWPATGSIAYPHARMSHRLVREVTE